MQLSRDGLEHFSLVNRLDTQRRLRGRPNGLSNLDLVLPENAEPDIHVRFVKQLTFILHRRTVQHSAKTS